jgi:hypothetical protein
MKRKLRVLLVAKAAGRNDEAGRASTALEDALSPHRGRQRITSENYINAWVVVSSTMLANGTSPAQPAAVA